MVKQYAPFGLRMDPDLKERVQAAADAANTSMNTIVCAVLEEAFPPLSASEAAIEKYNGLNRRMRAATDPNKKATLLKQREQAFADIIDFTKQD